MLYLLDTNICIYLMKKKPIACFEKLCALEKGNRIAMSVITLAELEFGIAKSFHKEKSRQALHLLLTQLEVLPYTDVCTKYYGVIRSMLTTQGVTIGPNDLLIASQALSLQATLVTHNRKEFDRILDLTVENWV